MVDAAGPRFFFFCNCRPERYGRRYREASPLFSCCAGAGAGAGAVHTTNTNTAESGLVWSLSLSFVHHPPARIPPTNLSYTNITQRTLLSRLPIVNC